MYAQRKPASILGNSAAAIAGLASQSLVQASYQVLVIKWLCQKSDRAGRQSLRTGPHLGKSSNENDGHLMSLGNQLALQFYSSHSRHLNVGNHAIGVGETIRFQEGFGGLECGSPIAKRAHKTGSGAAERFIIINNSDHGYLRQVGSFVDETNMTEDRFMHDSEGNV